ncbi:hypothetical protein G6020_16600 [Dietzia sp. B19]|uniref:hypothetical protein n=1 Tax=Dietzia sp. B19 TaxID=1630632 RepID=UPI0015F78D2B|nr:hypothetical protein [Dietzia sp. B19]MBB1058942.1 hypothetical protein [Dietzia sp. B19]
MPDLTGLPLEAGPVLRSIQQNQPTILGAGEVAISALSEDERRALLAEIDVADALRRVADLQAKWDTASAANLSLKPLHTELLLRAAGDWVPAVRAQVSKGRVFAVPQATAQLMRELLETDSSGAKTLAADEMARLLISIATQQQAHTEFESNFSTSAEMAALDAKFQAMATEDLVAFSHEFLHDQTANMLFSMPRKIECLKADAVDFWLSPWADRVDNSLGATPAVTFADATGIDLDEIFRAGAAIDREIATGQTVIRPDDLADDEKVRTFIIENMSLDLPRYREQLEADRATGDVKLQRYTFTRYPFLHLGDGNLLILRAVWAIERFFGDPVQFDVAAAFTDKGDEARAKRFNEAINYQFEKIVGDTLARIAARSASIDALITEPELEAQWTEKKGRKPSVCDWVLRAGSVAILVDATHHRLNAKLAQGLGSGKAYNADANRVLTAGKFKQFASVMQLVRRLGISGQPQPEANFIPFVVVPNSGTPSSMLTELDYGLRAQQVFAEFQGRVARPTVLQLQELQLLEGIGDRVPGDVVSFLYTWRKFPVPLSLQEFLDANGMPRPISRYIFRAAANLDRRLGNNG